MGSLGGCCRLSTVIGMEAHVALSRLSRCNCVGLVLEVPEANATTVACADARQPLPARRVPVDANSSTRVVAGQRLVPRLFGRRDVAKVDYSIVRADSVDVIYLPIDAAVDINPRETMGKVFDPIDSDVGIASMQAGSGYIANPRVMVPECLPDEVAGLGVVIKQFAKACLCGILLHSHIAPLLGCLIRWCGAPTPYHRFYSNAMC